MTEIVNVRENGKRNLPENVDTVVLYDFVHGKFVVQALKTSFFDLFFCFSTLEKLRST